MVTQARFESGSSTSNTQHQDVIIEDSEQTLGVKGYILQGIDLSFISGTRELEPNVYYVSPRAWKEVHRHVYDRQQ